MTVREAGEADIPELIELARACHEASIYEKPFSPEYSKGLMARLIASNDALVMTPESRDGLLVVVLAPYHFCEGVQALELVFWGRHGREMLAYAADWARARGADRFVCANEETEKFDAMARWYRMAGFEPVSRSYVRGL
jgi:GNAT superfamily N-acetyltransferase